MDILERNKKPDSWINTKLNREIKMEKKNTK